MKLKHLLAALLLGTALLLGGCGKAAPTDGGTKPEKGVPSEAESVEAGEPENPAGEDEEDAIGAHAGALDSLMELVYGTWLAEDGATAVICEDGSFTLYSPEGEMQCTGWLSYTEEDGTGQWETGPRYELYTYDGERVPETYFSVDEERPGEIALCEGGGAVAFQFDGPAPEVQTREVQVRVVTEEEVSALPEHDTFTAYEGDFPVLLLFTAEEPVTDFQFLSISFSGMEDDSLPAFDVVELYDGGALDRPLLVTTSFPGDMPTCGFSYRDAYGEMHWVSVSESGYDGSLVTGDFQAYYG